MHVGEVPFEKCTKVLCLPSCNVNVLEITALVCVWLVDRCCKQESLAVIRSACDVSSSMYVEPSLSEHLFTRIVCVGICGR